MRKNILLVLLCIFLLTLTGCGGETEEGNIPTENGGTPSESSLVFRLPEEHCPFRLMGVSGTHLYYYHTEIESSGEEYAENTVFYRQALEKGSEPMPMELPSENLLLRSSRIFTDSEGQDSIYLLLGEEKDGKLSYSLAGYDTDGRLLEEIALQETKAEGDYPESFLKLQDGSFAVITQKYFFVADSGERHGFLCPALARSSGGWWKFRKIRWGCPMRRKMARVSILRLWIAAMGPYREKFPLPETATTCALVRGRSSMWMRRLSASMT